MDKHKKFLLLKKKKIFNQIQRWLTPGIGIKRWVLIIFIGTSLIAVSASVLVVEAYRESSANWIIQFLSIVSLSFLPRMLRAALFGFIGMALLLYGLWGMNRSFLKPFIKPGVQIYDTLSAYRKLEKGPRIVAIGGGTGLSTLLRGLKQYTHKLTAIVTVSDDGGSSGEIRKNLGIPPPGDIRACLAALANDEALLSQVFQYRFGQRAGVNDHSLGNLFISALTDITGSFEGAVAESARVLAVRGQVMPSTLHDVKLVAEIQMPGDNNITRVVGESRIPLSEGTIKRLWLEPGNPLPFPPAIQEVLNADLIILGPGSLYTSILPNLLVPDLGDAIRASKALKFFVSNIANQHGETDNFTTINHIQVIEKHLGEVHFDVLLCNNDLEIKLPNGIEVVKPDETLTEQYSVYFAKLADSENPWRHDSVRLAETIMNLYQERTGPLLNKTSGG